MYPKALFGTLLTAGVVYVLIGMASSIALPAAELNSSSGPLLQVVEATGFGIPGPSWSPTWPCQAESAATAQRRRQRLRLQQRLRSGSAWTPRGAPPNGTQPDGQREMEIHPTSPW
ncbi:hypothetical protein NEK97_02140 [Paenarthrobacter sp. UW852]|nr:MULTISPECIES: hypothetical protein [Micrococcaceae]MCR1160260.1 hypothetical protein [Paenarthrobacter sp. UW852]